MRKLLLLWLAFLVMAGVVEAPFRLALATDAEEASFPGIEINRYAEVATTKGTLNMREEPKDNAKILYRLPRGAIVQIIDEYEEWAKVLYKNRTGFVKVSFINEIVDLPYELITVDSRGETVYAFKRALCRLGYLKSEDINNRFDWAMEVAMTKLQLMNGLPLNPKVVTPEVQALMEWGMILKGKTGYIDTAEDEESGLTVSLFCWDTGGMLYEADKSVKLEITYAAQATGGYPPYTITVKKSVSGAGEASADEVSNPFSHIWSQTTERLYVYATVVDAAGNTVTACAPFRYNLPSRYKK